MQHPIILAFTQKWRAEYRAAIEHDLRMAEYRVIQDNSITNRHEVKRLKQLLYRINST